MTRSGLAAGLVVGTLIAVSSKLFGEASKIHEIDFFGDGYFLIVYGLYVQIAWLLKAEIYWGPVVSRPSDSSPFDRAFDLLLGFLFFGFGFFLLFCR